MTQPWNMCGFRQHTYQAPKPRVMHGPIQGPSTMTLLVRGLSRSQDSACRACGHHVCSCRRTFAADATGPYRFPVLLPAEYGHFIEALPKELAEFESFVPAGLRAALNGAPTPGPHGVPDEPSGALGPVLEYYATRRCPRCLRRLGHAQDCPVHHSELGNARARLGLNS